MENLRAFARLYGYVRYFHPSDEAAGLDWEAFAVHGAGRVRDAADPDELRRRLGELVGSVAPTVRIYTDREPPPALPPELTPDDTAGLRVVAWQHLGVGLGNTNNVYRSVRTSRASPDGGEAVGGALGQVVDSEDLRGKRLRFSGQGRAGSPGTRLRLLLEVDRSTGPAFTDGMEDRPVSSTRWTRMMVEGPVADDAVRVVVGALVAGGEGALDDLRLEVREDGGWAAVPLANGSFEEGDGGAPAGWITGGGAGWTFALEAGPAPHGRRYAVARPSAAIPPGALFEEHPVPGDVVRKPLGRGLMVQMPLALYSRNGKTLGTPDPTAFRALHEDLEAVDPGAITPADPTLRVADVIIAWNVFQHFYPYWDVVDTDWDRVLAEALRRALADEGGADLLGTLRWMVAGLRDGHGRVFNPGFENIMGLPVRFDRVEDRVVVVATDAPEVVRVGDVVTTVDGRPAAELLDELADAFSGSLQWRRWRALGRFGWGPPGSEATLELSREGEPVSVTLERSTRELPDEPRPAEIEEVEPGIFYVDLDRAEMSAIEARAEELAGATGVVFDLRGYPNGNHLVLTHLTDRNLNSAFWRVPRITRPDHEGDPSYRESRWDLPPSGPRFQGRIAFVTDGRAISYAESVMGIVEHYRLGEIVGEPTAGANGNVNPFALPGGYRITWTGMRVVKHDGSQHHLVGIQPTVPVSRTLEGVRSGRDELLERALALVRGGA